MNKTTELPKEIKEIKETREKFNNTEIKQMLESISNNNKMLMKSVNDNINNALTSAINAKLQQISNNNKILMNSFNNNLNSNIKIALTSNINATLKQVSKIQFPSIPKPIINLPKYDFPIFKQNIQFTSMSKPMINFHKYYASLSNHWLDSIRSSMDVLIKKLNEIDNINRLIYKNEFEEHKKVSYKFYQKDVFPPINYLIDEEIYDIDDNFDIKEFILGDEVNKYYLKAINDWKYKYDDIYVQKLISEIEFNLEHKNSYSIILGISMLMERMLSGHLPEYMSRPGDYRYSSIKTLLKDKVFIPLNIDYLYYKFIKNNLYNRTEKARLFSRHMVHGKMLESGTMENAMNMIFIYDFIQEILLKRVPNVSISY